MSQLCTCAHPVINRTKYEHPFCETCGFWYFPSAEKATEPTRTATTVKIKPTWELRMPGTRINPHKGWQNPFAGRHAAARRKARKSQRLARRVTRASV